MSKTWILALALGLAPLALQADVAAARAAFGRGQALEKAKNYPAAIQEYRAALAAEPRFAWAYKQLGNCYYYSGDKAQALRNYDAYLRVVKNDPNTQAFADRLRTQVPGGEAPEAAAATVAAAKGAGKTWRIAPTLGYHMLSFKDWNDLVKPANAPTDPNTTYPTVSSGLSLGVGFGYALGTALELGLDLDYYMVGTQSKSKSTFFESTTDYNFNLLWAGPQLSYAFARVAGGKLAFDAGLGLGFGILMGGSSGKSKSGTSESTSKATYSGSGVGFKARVGADWDFSPGFGLGLDLGYRILSVPKVEYSSTFTPSTGSPTTSSGTFKKAANEDLALDYSGLDMKLGFNIRF
jgi:hypothetical protein